MARRGEACRRGTRWPPHTVMLKETETAVRAVGLTLQPVSPRRADNLDGAFAAMARARAEVLVALAGPGWAPLLS